MSTIIVFSKDRPMQLHAYLESLIKASGCQEEQIYILYREVLPICYDKVKAYFPDVNWIGEENFDKQLRQLISSAEDYVMFGCDDVIFTDSFDLNVMEKYLKEHEEVFGFSLRLGKNIGPLPAKLQREKSICSWDWTQNKGHYGYPWELDCTLYRREHVISILQKIEKVDSPNFLEAIPEERPGEYISTRRLASYYDHSKAMVITVNRVQETHPNQVDDSGVTDILSLYIQYQYEGRTLDLDRIWQCRNRQIHVGREFFWLIPSVTEDLHAVNNGIFNKLRNLFRNLRFLSLDHPENITKKYMWEVMGIGALQSMASDFSQIKAFGPEETVEKLTMQPKSFCRFGDGEFTLMLGGSIGFQKYDPELALELWKIFWELDDDIYVGIPYQQLEMPFDFNPWIREFYFTSGGWVRKFLYQYLPVERDIYIDTGFNQVYQTYQGINFSGYYAKVKQLFADKKVTIIAGEGILDKLSSNVFEFVSDIDYIWGPKNNAFDAYDDILQKALKVSKDRLICAILGPCSKVLVRDLTKAGYIAWDIGHLAKDYDSFRKRTGRKREDIAKFYAPD